MSTKYQPNATEEVSNFVKVAILGAIRIYVRSNGQMKANRAYTSKNMRNWVTDNISGKKYKAGMDGLRAAYADLAENIGKPTTF